MSSPPDNHLLKLANDLIIPTKQGAPSHALLRRSISTAYYSLFSLLVEAAATEIVGGTSDQKYLRGYVMRAISHQAIREVCKGFANKNLNSKIKKILGNNAISDDLAYVARTFYDLQFFRNEADYNYNFADDISDNFSRRYVKDILETVEKAHQSWARVKDQWARKVFLIALIVDKDVKTSGQPFTS